MPLALSLLSILAVERLTDPGEIVKRLATADRRNREVSRQYTFVQRSEERELDAQGRVQKTESKTVDVSYLYGRPYSRVVARNDKPLPPAEIAKEEEKFRKESVHRRLESESDRRKLVERDTRRREEFRKMIDEVGKAYYLKLEGLEKIDSRDVYRIAATPRPDYDRILPPYSLLKNMKGTMWIDTEEFQMVKVDAEVVGTLSVGLFLVRVSEGTKLHFEQTRVNGEVWMPKYAASKIDGRLGLIKKIRAEQTTTWKDFRKFQTD